MAAKEKSLKIGKKCCIFDCENTDLNDKDVSFYRVVRSRSQKQSEEWIKIIRKKNGQRWTPTKDTRICGAHFVTGEFSLNSDHPDFLPSIFAGSSRSAKESDVARLKRRDSRDFQPNPDDNINEPKFKDQSTWTETIGIRTAAPKPEKSFHHITKQVTNSIHRKSHRYISRSVQSTLTHVNL